MNDQELAKFLAENATVETRKQRVIKSRHYNIVVKRDGILVENVEYLTLRQAREIKKAYHDDAEGAKITVDIIEDVTILADDTELVIPERPIMVQEPKPAIGFGTPEATKRRIENDREKMRLRNVKRINSKGKAYRIVGYTMSDPKSPLFNMYMDNVARKGYEVREKETNAVIFLGLQQELTAWLVGGNWTMDKIKNDLDIRFIGR